MADEPEDPTPHLVYDFHVVALILDEFPTNEIGEKALGVMQEYLDEVTKSEGFLGELARRLSQQTGKPEIQFTHKRERLLYTFEEIPKEDLVVIFEGKTPSAENPLP